MKYLLILFALIIIAPSVGICDENVTLPYTVQIEDTNKAQRGTILLTFGNNNEHIAKITYALLNNAGTEVVESRTILLEGQQVLDFVDSFGTLLKSRTDAIINQDIQSRHTTIP